MKKDYCITCKYQKGYYRYKIRRKDGKDCIMYKCEHLKVIDKKYKRGQVGYTKVIAYSREGLYDAMKTSPRWCPLKARSKCQK